MTVGLLIFCSLWTDTSVRPSVRAVQAVELMYIWYEIWPVLHVNNLSRGFNGRLFQFTVLLVSWVELCVSWWSTQLGQLLSCLVSLVKQWTISFLNLIIIKYDDSTRTSFRPLFCCLLWTDQSCPVSSQLVQVKVWPSSIVDVADGQHSFVLLPFHFSRSFICFTYLNRAFELIASAPCWFYWFRSHIYKQNYSAMCLTRLDSPRLGLLLYWQAI